VATNKLGGITDWTQRGESKSDQHQHSEILTIADSMEDEEWGEMDTSGKDVW